jgi:preprotein translocase subunit SecE
LPGSKIWTKEGEVADSRRRRSDDDEFEAELSDFDEADELDDVTDDEDDDRDTSTVGRGRTTTSAKAASTRTVARPRPKSTKKDEIGPGILGRLIRFVREVVAELQKVIWPTRKELLTYTSVVVVFVTIMMTVVALLDLGFAKSMFVIFGGQTTPGTGTGQ